MDITYRLRVRDQDAATGKIDALEPYEKIRDLDQEIYAPVEAEAASLLREALEGSRAVLGARQPDTLISAANLGVLLRDMGSSAEGEMLLRQAREGVAAQKATAESLGGLGAPAVAAIEQKMTELEC